MGAKSSVEGLHVPGYPVNCKPKAEAQPSKGRNVMKTLDLKSTEIFCLLMAGMKGEQHLKIENKPYMALTIERLDDAYGGNASLYSLCHYYELNGDLMQDPEMCFVVVDARTAETPGYENVQVTPYYFAQANLGFYEQSIVFDNGVMKRCDDELQHGQVEFAGIWLKNIKGQGYLKRVV